ERADVNALRAAVHSVGPRVSGAVGNFLSLDGPDQLQLMRPPCWRKLDRSLREVRNHILHEPPGFTTKKLVEPGRRALRHVQDRGPLERVLPDIVDYRHVSFDLRSGPAVRLVVELVLEVIHPHRPELGPSEIEDLMAGGRRFALKQIELVGAVEMVLVGSVAQGHALEKLILDVRIARGGKQAGIPVEAGEDSVFDGARFDMARPATDS